MRIQATVQVKKELGIKTNFSIEIINILRDHFARQDNNLDK